MVLILSVSLEQLTGVNDVEWAKKDMAAALLIVAGANTTGILNIFNPHVRADAFTSLDGALMKAEILGKMNTEFDIEHDRHIENEININNLIYRMSQCEKMK